MNSYRNFRGELITNCPKGEGLCWEPNHLTKEQYELQASQVGSNAKSTSNEVVVDLLDDPTDDIISINEYEELSSESRHSAAKEEFPVKLVIVSRAFYREELLKELALTKKQLRAAKFSRSDEVVRLEEKYQNLEKEEKMLFKQMKEECWRCYGTGNMDGLQIDKDLSSPFCEECGTSNYMRSEGFVKQAQEIKGSMYKKALGKYAVKLTDDCQKCGEAKLMHHEIRGGFLKRTVIGSRIRCQACGYDQKDLSFLHAS